MANTQINITENGTTTLATVGHFCDRNIDINVNVASTGGSLEDFIPNKAFNVTGDASYRYCGNSWQWFIDEYGDNITTSNISKAQNMFYSNHLAKEIPFDINLITGTTNGVSCSDMFNDCTELLRVPYVKGSIGSMTKMFQNCTNLIEFPDDWGDYIEWDYFHSYKYAGIDGMFYACRRLRRLPDSLMCHLWTSNDYIPYGQQFGYCCRLDEVNNLPVQPTTINYNKFTLFVDYCHRLKNLTFATQADGAPQTVQWKTQVVDLTKNVGYSKSVGDVIDNYTGITADKEVKDDTTYQALKNDPDWFTCNVAYSRYNHDSAVATINSLPDTSVYGTNTIKFTGAAGSATDGGAINTLTEEEIAVAAAKGWTVTLA